MYQPLWNNRREEIQEYRHDLENTIASSREEKLLVIGGDHNSQIGAGPTGGEVRGRWGHATRANETGEDLLGWCSENGLAYANSCSPHKHLNGTWYNRALRRRYELDGFLVRSKQRHGLVKKIKIDEHSRSDHKPVISTTKKTQRRWRKRQGRRVAPQINHQKLKCVEEKKGGISEPDVGKNEGK